MAKPLANPQQQYLKTQIETASQPQLLVMIFDAAVKKLHISRRAIESKKIEKAHNELTKVQRIFTELMVSLDFDKGGDLANQLVRLYDFIYHQLVQANIKQDVAMIDEVLPIVENLREGWTKAVEKYRSEQDEAKPAPKQPGTALGKVAVKTVPQPVPPANHTYSRPVATSVPRPTAPPDPDAQSRPRLNLRG